MEEDFRVKAHHIHADQATDDSPFVVRVITPDNDIRIVPSRAELWAMFIGISKYLAKGERGER